MASAQANQPCAKCPKGVGVTTCNGCRQSFCPKHFIEHRQELTTRMDALRQDLHEKDTTDSVLLKINQWEEESIRKIQTAAETARKNLREFLDQSNNDLKSSIEEITNDLNSNRESEAYTEIDLDQWSIKLDHLRKSLDALPTVELVETEDTVDVIRLINIRVETPPPPITSWTPSLKRDELVHEIFCEATKSITLSEDGLLATMTDSAYTYGTVFGKKSYSNGAHEIHFRIENKGYNNFFFGIVTSSEANPSAIYGISSVNGWWGYDVPVLNGENQRPLVRRILQTGDMIKLTLDCSNKEILLENEQIKVTLQCRINIENCPLPWKIAISLSRQNDALRLCHVC